MGSCKALHAALDGGPVPTVISLFFLNKSLASVRYYEEIVGKKVAWDRGVGTGHPDLGPSVVMPGAQMAPSKYGLQSCACTVPVASQIISSTGEKKAYIMEIRKRLTLSYFLPDICIPLWKHRQDS